MGAIRKSFDIFVNADAGRVQAKGRAPLEEAIAQSGIAVRNLHFSDAGALLSGVADSNGDAHILVAGGDGTIKGCAELMLGRDRPFGILPLGTMNLLARDLGVPLDFGAALAAYAAGVRPVRVDVGIVNKEIFLCAACLGTIPEASLAREEKRGEALPVILPGLTATLLQEMDKMARRRIRLRLDGRTRTIHAATLVVANNMFDHDEDGGLGAFRRGRLDCGMLGVYAARPASWWDKLRLFLRMQGGGWQHDPAVREWCAKALTVRTRRDSELLSLDGETVSMTTPLEFSVRPRSLSLLVPEGAAAGEAAA